MDRLSDLTARMREMEAHNESLKSIFCIARHPEDLDYAALEAETRFGKAVASKIKTAIPAASSTASGWATEVNYARLTGELVSVLNQNSLLALPWRRVDFNTRTLKESAPGSAGWVGEGEPIPVGKMNIGAVNVEMTKIGGIVVLTNEVLKVWTPATANSINRALIDTVGRYVDLALLNPNIAAVSGKNPASLTNGLTPIASPAATEAGFTAAFKALLQARVDGGSDLKNVQVVMSPTTALTLSLMLTAGNVRAFPNLGVRGGEIAGVPVTTTAGAATQGSPTENLVVAVDPTRVLLADDGAVEISAGKTTVLQMDDAPATGAASGVSMFQTETTALKFIRRVNFERADTSAVGYFTTSF